MDFCERKNVSALRYLDFCTLGESTNFKICDVIIVHIRSYSYDCFFKTVNNIKMDFFSEISAACYNHLQLISYIAL